MKENLGCLRAGDVIVSASDIDELLRYRELKEQGRMVILPDGMNLRKLLDILTEYSPGCPIDYNLTNRCELSCFECWLAALKGAENDTRTND